MHVGVNALISRCATVLLAVMADYVLPDHSPDGALRMDLPPECPLSPALTSAFTRWDSAHFLSVTASGWADHEYSHAFFPMFPLLIRWLAALLSHMLPPLCETELHILAGVLLSNSAFVVAACCLHRLGECVLQDARLARTSALMFCVSPASIFFSTVYAESTFAAATFGGMLLLECSYAWAGSVALALATATRANGLLHVLLVAHAGLRRCVHILDAPIPGHRQHAATVVALAGAILSMLLQVLLVVGPYVAWQVAGYRRVCGASDSAAAAAPLSRPSKWEPAAAAAAAATAAAAAAAAAGPSALTAAARLTPTRIMHEARVAAVPADWCEQKLPDLYAYVQRHYWGVNLFGYYEWRQLPNFALAAPALGLCAAAGVSCLAAARVQSARTRPREALRCMLGLRALRPAEASEGTQSSAQHGARRSSARRAAEASEGTQSSDQHGARRSSALRAAEASEGSGDRPSTAEGALTPRVWIYALHWALLSGLVLLFGNVQVGTRLAAAACPPFYWFMAHILLLRGGGDALPRATGTWLGSRRLRSLLCGYVAIFASVGTVLHANFFPWT